MTAASSASSPETELSPRPVPSAGARLQVYVTAACGSCARARELVAHLRRSRPGAAVELVDLDQLPPGHPLPAGLVGTPTYLLSGRVRWLGNPDPAELLAAWDSSHAPTPPPPPASTGPGGPSS